MPKSFSRREFLQASAALALSSGLTLKNDAFGSDNWNAGEVVHLLPTANHERILLKASFRNALKDTPQLRIGGRHIKGRKSDGDGRFWQFDVTGLKAETVYTLQLVDVKRAALCAPWPLRTFPAPDASPDRVRLLVYTCAGGHPDTRGPGGIEAFRSLAIRHALLDRGLSYQPDAIIANGDHVYWDQRTWLESNNAQIRKAATDFYNRIGMFNTAQPVLGTDNERILKAAVDPQIAQLYGTRLRSTPVFFMMDDHDYFENDEAEENFVTFPPDHFDLSLARTVQHMYFPEFLPGPARPLMLPGSNASDRAPEVSECFGTLRYGQLLEILMYDCGRYLSLKDRH
ncbi:MAG: alkaline phosphatase D family protein, partial [Noviherbaspirillum sp.]